MESLNNRIIVAATVSLAVFLSLPTFSWANESQEIAQQECIESLASYLRSAQGSLAQLDEFESAATVSTQSCLAKGACRAQCRSVQKTCKSARPDCKKACKKAPGKSRKVCATSCAKLISEFKADCRDSKKSCRVRCSQLKTGSQCNNGLKRLIKSVAKVKKGDQALLKKARGICKAALSGKTASSGTTKRDQSAVKGQETDSVQKIEGDGSSAGKTQKKGKKKITVASVDKAISKAKEVMESKCGQAVKKHANGVFTGIKKARNACKALRGCKKICRQTTKSGRKQVRTSKKACKKKCKKFKKKSKRQCIKACQKPVKSQKRKKRISKKSCMSSCRKKFKTPACTSARSNIIKSLFKAVTALADNDKCREYVKEAHDALKKSDKAENMDKPETNEVAPASNGI